MNNHTPEAARILKVLVVDDNQDGAFSLAMLIKALGHQATIANDGVTALRLTAEHRPDLILLDIGMPAMSGDKVCRAIRETEFGQSVMIVAQTGWAHEPMKQMTKEAGFDDHLVKPIDLGLLKELLSLAIAKAKH